MKGKTRIFAVERRNDLLVVAALAVVLALGVLVAAADRTAGTFIGQTANPSNTLATATSLWFDATGTATSICTGLNSTLACAYGNQPRPVSVTATFTLTNKNAASNSFSLSIVNGTGPATLSTILRARFASNNSTSKTLAAGATDTVNLRLTTTTSTPVGTYTGWVRVSDTTTGRSFSIPISVTVQ